MMIHFNLSLITTTFLLLFQPHTLQGARAPLKSLTERVDEAEKVFAGKLINKKVEDEWATAELLVETPFSKTEKGLKIPVMWRTSLGGNKMYNPEEGTRGVAILKPSNDGKYWLRTDTFLDISELEKVKAALSGT